MFYNFTVRISDVTGTTCLLKNKSATYVQLELDRVYDPKRKFNIPKRTIIGKVCPDNPDFMYPNDKFMQRFPEFSLPEENNSSTRSCCLKIGSYLVIKKIFEEYGLTSMIRKQLNADAGLFMDLVSYLIVNEDNAGQYYPDYAFCHPLFSKSMRIFSDSTVSRLFRKINRDQSIGFLDDWNTDRDHRQRIYISYDSTNKTCQAGELDLLEFGKPKNNKDLPIFNFAIAFDKDNKVPLFYEEYPGSINDVSQVEFFMSKVRAYGYQHIGFVLDRGYFSEGNIRKMDKEGYQFVMMVKGCKPLVNSMIYSKKGMFEEDRKYYIAPSKDLFGITVVGKLFSDDKDRYFHLFYNSQRACKERLQLNDKLDKLQANLNSLIGQFVEFGDIYKHYYDLYLDKNGHLVAFEEKREVTKRELSLCGYFAIITSERMSASDAYFIYKGRDPSEKLFRSDKTFIGSRSMRIQSNESLHSKIWFEFVALIVRNRIYNLLKDEMIRLNVRKNYMTVPTAIKELDKIEMVRRNGDLYRLDHAVTKTQRIILGSFGLSVDDVRNEAAKIAVILKKQNSVQQNDNIIDREDDYAETDFNSDDREEDFESEI